jgi:hypothetical protein
MAWLEIPYKTAKKRYPKEVAEVMKKVRAGKSKHRNSDPNLWAWGFSWCVLIEGSIRGSDFAKMIAGKKEFPKEKELTPDEEVEDYGSRATVHLSAKIGKTEWGSHDPIEFPKEIAEMIRKDRKEADIENARFNALSPEEKDREVNDALRQLSRSPGFVAIGMGGPEAPLPKGLVAQGPGGPEDILFKPLDGDTGSILAKINSAIKKR